MKGVSFHSLFLLQFNSSPSSNGNQSGHHVKEGNPRQVSVTLAKAVSDTAALEALFKELEISPTNVQLSASTAAAATPAATPAAPVNGGDTVSDGGDDKEEKKDEEQQTSEGASSSDVVTLSFGSKDAALKGIIIFFKH